MAFAAATWCGAPDRSAYRPLRFLLTGGQQHDITQAAALISGINSEHVQADRGYDAEHFRETIIESGSIPVVPYRSNIRNPGSYDVEQYRERHLVECFIGKFKHYRHLFSRSDKLASRYLGFLQFTAALMWLK